MELRSYKLTGCCILALPKCHIATALMSRNCVESQTCCLTIMHHNVYLAKLGTSTYMATIRMNLVNIGLSFFVVIVILVHIQTQNILCIMHCACTGLRESNLSIWWILHQHNQDLTKMWWRAISVSWGTPSGNNFRLLSMQLFAMQLQQAKLHQLNEHKNVTKPFLAADSAFPLKWWSALPWCFSSTFFFYNSFA